LETRVFRTRPGSPSLLVMILGPVADALRLRPGDTVEWSLEACNGEHIAVIKRARKA